MTVNSTCWSVTAWPTTGNERPSNWWTRAVASPDPNSCPASPRSRTLARRLPSCPTPTSRPSNSPIRWRSTSSAPFKSAGTSARISAAVRVAPPPVTSPSELARRPSRVGVVTSPQRNDRMLASTASSRSVNWDVTQ